MAVINICRILVVHYKTKTAMNYMLYDQEFFDPAYFEVPNPNDECCQSCGRIVESEEITYLNRYTKSGFKTTYSICEECLPDAKHLGRKVSEMTSELAEKHFRQKVWEAACDGKLDKPLI